MSGLSIGYPLPLSTVLTSHRVIPGDTILLREGVYSGIYIYPFLGTAVERITIQPYPGEHVVIDGGLVVNGSDVTFRDLEFRYSGWTSRVSSQAGSTPTDIPVGTDLAVYAPRCKFINCVIHDLESPGFWAQAVDAEFYGCVIYASGWTAPDRGHGHGLYTQNLAGPTKLIKHNIIFNTFGWGIHAYSTNGAGLQNFDFLENTCFNAGSLDLPTRNILIGADHVKASNIRLIGNMTYNSLTGILFYSTGADNVTLERNYCPDGKTGVYAAISELDNYWGPGTGDRVFLYPNDYEAGRANLIIYNGSRNNHLAISVGSVLAPGDSYALYNVQDYDQDIQTGIVGMDGTIAVDMSAENRTVSTPVAWTAPPTTFPEFGAFVLKRVDVETPVENVAEWNLDMKIVLEVGTKSLIPNVGHAQEWEV